MQKMSLYESKESKLMFKHLACACADGGVCENWFRLRRLVSLLQSNLGSLQGTWIRERIRTGLELCEVLVCFSSYSFVMLQIGNILEGICWLSFR